VVTEQGIQLARAIEGLNNDYLEDRAFGLNGMRQVRERARTALATNTAVVNLDQLATNVRDLAVDVVLLDLHPLESRFQHRKRHLAYRGNGYLQSL
jgi:L-alanine-DL-glutamate epimerase-like enolase superfamily enzyme